MSSSSQLTSFSFDWRNPLIIKKFLDKKVSVQNLVDTDFETPIFGLWNPTLCPVEPKSNAKGEKSET